MNTIHIFSREIEYSKIILNNYMEEFVFDNMFKAENLTKLLEAL